MTSRTIIAVFDTPDAAQNARESLLNAGIEQERISIVDQSSSEFSTESDTHRGGFWAHVKQMFMPDEDRATLDESLRRGNCVLTASVDDDRADEAITCLEDAGAIDLDERQAQWRSQGWQGGSVAQPAAEPLAEPMEDRRTEDGRTEEAIPVVEEQLRVGKREVNRGGVRVRSYIVEEPVREQVQLHEERVDVERRPVDAPTRPVPKSSPEDLFQERTLEVTERGEEPVVAKEARVKEEVRVRKTSEDRVEDIDDTVRRTEVEVDDTRAKPGKSTGTRDPNRPGRV
jgi:uncharacterized protein (TIGR02271 family)